MVRRNLIFPKLLVMLGVAAFAHGLWQWWPPAAWMAGGVIAVAAGLLLDFSGDAQDGGA